jgi:hypothetical protein
MEHDGGKGKRYMQGDTRATHREVTYRLTDDGDSVTGVGDHVANDGGTEQRTEKEVGESLGAITVTGKNDYS